MANGDGTTKLRVGVKAHSQKPEEITFMPIAESDILPVEVEASATWHNAVTLNERLTAYRAGDSTGAFNRQLAQEQMEAWRSQEPFIENVPFERLLETYGVTENEFLQVLGEQLEPSRYRSASWVKSLLRAFQSHSNCSQRDSETGFTTILSPLIDMARTRLQKAAVALASRGPVPFDPETVASLFVPSLVLLLLQMMQRTLVLELHVSKLTESLNGDTPEERFQNYVKRMSEPSRMLTLLEEYPVLARQMTLAVDQWAAVSLEFLERLSRDSNDIRVKFAIGADPGKLVSIDGGKGDTHRRGRSVLIAQFESGLRVVYKPRCTSLDQHFQDLLNWVNDKLQAESDQPLFRTLGVLDRGDYGWVEFVDGSECTDRGQIQRFYRRQGGYIALLYALGATDMHAQNVIAHGEHPVVVDLEALLHANLDCGNESDATTRLARDAMMNSVLRSGLLPQRVFADEASDGVDLSALGSAGEQLTPQPVPHWVGDGTDELRMVRERLPMGISGNRPKLNGTESSVLDYGAALEAGFKAIYHLLKEHRAELLGEAAPLEAFANDEVRTILRATQTYAVLLRESFHPDMLRDALERDRLFAQLWVQVEQMPYLARAIRAETEDLEHGDIPVFTSRPDSRDLWTATGERIADFYSESSLASVRRRLQQMDDNDLERQLWLIRALLAAASPNKDLKPIHPPLLTTGHFNSSLWIDAARAVGDRVERLAHQGEGVATWMALSQASANNWAPAPVGTDLYDGATGIALFLAYLGSITMEQRYVTLARAAIRGVHETAAAFRDHMTSVGGFDGWGGLLYAFTHLGHLWQDQELLAEAAAIADRLPSLIAKDEGLDIIGGSAGCIGALLSLYRYQPSRKILDTARQCGEHLLERAQAMSRGIAWEMPAADNKTLGGFAHGVAGIAWALLELASATGEEKFRAAGLEAIEYDRSLFSNAHGNWLDLRHNGVCSTAWCHGAPGIGLSRFGALRHFNDETMRDEIAIAVAVTLKSGLGLGDCLCHGDMGNLLFLTEAAEFVAPEDRERARLAATGIAHRAMQGDTRCGNPMEAEAPGLMTGLAGIGYGLLRLADPERVPNMLLLESPRRIGQ
jgi:type 2 lantibiotic biosynthesis protein LanM